MKTKPTLTTDCTDATDKMAAEQIQLQGKPDEIAGRYRSLLSDLYWKQRDLPAVVAIGRAGIQYCLTQSCGEGIDTGLAATLRSTAKALAYDVGSFTWPGWEEPGIVPTESDLSAGRECAALNLQLAIELKKPADRLAMAHWLVGAHALTARDADLAQQQFQLAVDVLPANVPASEPLKLYNLGCVALARLCRKADDAAAVSDFEQIISQLTHQATEDAATYPEQLRSARRLFTWQKLVKRAETGDCPTLFEAIWKVYSHEL